MNDRDPESSTEAGQQPAQDKAKEMRAELGARQEAEALLAEASEARRTAAAEADGILEKAQEVADELVDGARRDAEHETEAARERAAGIVAKAKDDADEILRKVEAECDRTRAEAETELQEFRERVRAEAADEARAQFDALHREAAQLLAGLDERFDAVRASLKDAESSGRTTLEQLGRLRDAVPSAGRDAALALPGGERADAATERDDASAEEPAADATGTERFRPLSDALEWRESEDSDEDGEQRDGEAAASKETRPLGWLFRHQP